MSRVGKLPVAVKGVETSYDDNVVTMKTAKGSLSLTIPTDYVSLDLSDDTIVVSRLNDEKQSRALHGTIRARLNNMVVGLTDGFSKKLEFNGVGYNVSVAGSEVKMNLGYSHPVNEQIPEGITCTAEGNVLTIAGYDKEVVGEFSAKVRSWRLPEPYLGKGIKYSDEIIIRKQGKKIGG